MTNIDPKKVGRKDEEYEKPWTFITNHAAVLSLLANHPRITAREFLRRRVSRSAGSGQSSTIWTEAATSAKYVRGGVSDTRWTLSDPCAIRRCGM